MLLSEAIERLVIATQADGLSPNTTDGYRRKLKPLLDFLGDVPVEEITTDDLRRYVACLRGRTTLYPCHPHHKERKGTLSLATINGHVRAFKRLFNFLEAEGVIESAPSQKIKTPRPPRHEPKSADLKDAEAMLGAISGDTPQDRRDRAIILFLIDTECRVGGLCRLKVSDIDLEKGEALVTEKGEKSRIVFFRPETAEALRAWLEVRPNDQGDWLFVSLENKAREALSVGAVEQVLRRRAQKAGVKGRVNPHAWRHAFARRYICKGGDLATLSDLMGHASLEITKASYAIFTKGELREKHQRYSPVTELKVVRSSRDDGTE